MFGIDERGDTAQLLHLGDDLQAECGLSGRLRAIDLDNPTPWQAADAERNVQSQRAGGYHLDVYKRQMPCCRNSCFSRTLP